MGETFCARPPQGCITYRCGPETTRRIRPRHRPARLLSGVRAARRRRPKSRLAAHEANNAPVVRTPPGGLGGRRRRVPRLHRPPSRRACQCVGEGAYCQAGVLCPAPSCHEGTHASATSFTGHVLLGRPHAHGLERLGRCVAARAELLRVGLEGLIQIGELLLKRLDGLLGAAHVLLLLEDASRAARRGGGAAERARRERVLFAPEESAETVAPTEIAVWSPAGRGAGPAAWATLLSCACATFACYLLHPLRPLLLARMASSCVPSRRARPLGEPDARARSFPSLSPGFDSSPSDGLRQSRSNEAVLFEEQIAL